MAQIWTLQKLINEFEAIASAHLEIQTFGYGNLFSIDPQVEINKRYPQLWVQPSNSQLILGRNNNMQNWTFNVYAYDLIRQDETNQISVWNTTNQIITDVIQLFNYQSSEYKIVNTPISTPFEENFGDDVTGYFTQITIQTAAVVGDCGIPISGSTTLPSPNNCSPGSVTLNSTFVANVSSGGSLNVDVKNTEGDSVGSLIGNEWIVDSGTQMITASFSVNDTTALTNQVLTFTDASDLSPTIWNWNFGDGSASTQQNPTHSYTMPGTYSISLAVSNGTDVGYLNRSNYVVVTLETPPQTNLQAWYKAGSGASPTNMTLSGTRVVQWTDSINSYHLSGATAGDCPVYNDNILNGYAGLVFTNNELTNSNVLFTRVSGTTVFIVWKLNSLAGTGVLHQSDVGFLYEIYFTNAQPFFYNGSVVAAQWGMPQNTPVIMIDSFQGAASYHQYGNLPKELVGNPGTGASSGFKIGRAASGSNIPGTIYEILVYSSEPSSGDKLLINQYLSTKFNI